MQVTYETIEDFCTELIMEQFGIEKSELMRIKNKTCWLADLDADSLDVAEILYAIEKTYKIKITNGDIIENQTFVDFVQSVTRLCNLGTVQEIQKNKEISVEPVSVSHTEKPSNKHPGFCITVKNQPFCKLMEAPCVMPKQENNTDKPYCEFVKCKLYENFNKLR